MARRRRIPANTRKLLINASEPEEIRIAILQAGRLDEYYIERGSLGSTLGNIYKARVTNVEKSIGAAFIEFGHSRQGFLHISDLCMAAVSDDARELLATVQAAREVAHDEDVVERRAAGTRGADAGDTGGDAGAGATGEAATGGDRPAGGEAAAEGGLPAEAASGELDEGDDEPESDDDLSYSPDSIVDPWTGEEVVVERGEQVAELDEDEADEEASDGGDEPPEGELAETLTEIHVGLEDDSGDGEGDADEDPLPDLDAGGRGAGHDSGDLRTGAGVALDEPAFGAVSRTPGQLPSSDERRPAEAARGGEYGSVPGAADGGEAGDAGADEEQGGDSGQAPAGDGEGGGSEEGGRRGRRRRGRRRGGRGRGARPEAEGAAAGGRAELADGAQGGGAVASPAAESAEDEDDDQDEAEAGGDGALGDDEGEGGEGAGDKRRRRGGRRAGRRRPGREGRSRDARAMPAIEEVLEKGQEIVVQVIKDGIGTKGPTLTTFLSIPGRFIVLMRGIRKRGVSRKVASQAERDRLKKLIGSLECPDNLGFIVRTAGSDCSLEDLQRDLDYLLRLWQQMKVRAREHKAPVLLYQENDLVIRTLRDLYDGQGDVVIDDEATARTAREFLDQIMPDRVEKVQAYSDEKPLFSHYGIEAELGRLLQSRLELKSGASLVIEQTEALVAIDVNSGRYKPDSSKDIDDTAFAVNCEAAVEIARQLRLRDLGGVVVIDFIDMRYEKHRKHLERLFKDELRKDRARIKVARFSPFGILEMTRQRVRPSLKRTVHQKCPYCESTGFIPSDETSCLATIRKIRENLWRQGAVLVVTVRPEVAEAVLNSQKRVLVDLEAQGRKQIFIRADHRLAYEDIEVRPMITLPDELDHRRA